MRKKFVSHFIPQPSVLNRPLKAAFILSLTSLCASLASCASVLPDATQNAAPRNDVAQSQSKTVETPKALSFLTMTIPGNSNVSLTNTQHPDGASKCENGRCVIQFDSGTFAENIARKDTLLISTK